MAHLDTSAFQLAAPHADLTCPELAGDRHQDDVGSLAMGS